MATPTPSDPRIAFSTHSNYLRAFAMLTRHDVSASADTLSHVAAQFRTLDPPGGTPTDPTGALQSLGLAWRTELLLDLTSGALDGEELTRIANTWAVVQVYYIFYHSTLALAQAKGFPRTTSHPKAQNYFRDFWTGRRACLPPWTLSGGSSQTNVPSHVSINDEIDHLCYCDEETCWSLAAKALRTTRQREVDESMKAAREAERKGRERAWKTEEAGRLAAGKRRRTYRPVARPQLTAAQKQSVETRVPPATLMDYLYRLRIRVNYQDSSMFTDGPTAEGESTAVRDDLRMIASTTLLVHELSLTHLLGRDTVMGELDKFIQEVVPPAGYSSLRARLPHLRG